MHIPHTFPSLLDSGATPSILLIGAGMSFGIAPPVTELTNEIYDWADKAFSKLRSELNLTDHEAKLRLADAIRITTDPRFQAKVGMPLRGNTPRHRVVARFAREGRSRLCQQTC